MNTYRKFAIITPGNVIS